MAEQSSGACAHWDEVASGSEKTWSRVDVLLISQLIKSKCFLFGHADFMDLWTEQTAAFSGVLRSKESQILLNTMSWTGELHRRTLTYDLLCKQYNSVALTSVKSQPSDTRLLHYTNPKTHVWHQFLLCRTVCGLVWAGKWSSVV